MPLVIAISGLKGGVGRTTLTANLASALVQAGRRAAAVDLDPQNGLCHHFGRGPARESGIADLENEVRALDRRDAGRTEAVCVPFGNPAPEALATAEQKLIADGGWLRRRIQSAVPAGIELVLLDTPAQRGPWSLRALEMADLVLSVLAPEPASYATLPAMESLLRETRGARPELGAHYVVNRFDAGSATGRDVVAALRGSLGERVSPLVIHADESVPDALGRQRTLVREASNSQALADIIDLGDWLLTALGTDQKPTTARAAAAGARS